MKLIRLMREELLPLSSRQNLIILVIVSCVFQFALFFSPALAEDTVRLQADQATAEETIMTGGIIRDENMNSAASRLSPERLILPAVAAQDPVQAEAEPVFYGPEVNPDPATTTPKYRVIRTSTHIMTAYNSEVGQTDDSPCITANGFDVCKHGIEDTIAANFLKFGTKVQIPELFGDRVFVVRDRMNKRYPSRVDIWMLKRQDALKFGVRTATIQVIEEIE